VIATHFSGWRHHAESVGDERISEHRRKVMIAKHGTKFLLAAVAASALTISPGSARAEVHVSVGIGLPPPVVFTAAPQLVALPGTYVYVDPTFGEDIFFADGWWWRPWHGHWYRSHYYDRDWENYSSVPYFYHSIPSDWRGQYSRHEWRGHPYNYESVSYDDVHRNWSTWKRERRWSDNHSGEARPVTREVHSAPTTRHEYHGSTTHQTSVTNPHHESYGTTTRHSTGAAATHHENHGAQQHQGHPQAHQPQMHEANHAQGGKHSSQAPGNQGHSNGGHGNSHQK